MVLDLRGTIEPDWAKLYRDQWQEWRERGDALYQFRYPISAETIRAVADEIDCGSGCEHVGPMDWETGVSECRQDDAPGLGCRASIASELRAFAEALETAAKVRTTDRLGAYSGFPPSILAHIRHGWREFGRFIRLLLP